MHSTKRHQVEDLDKLDVKRMKKMENGGSCDDETMEVTDKEQSANNGEDESKVTNGFSVNGHVTKTEANEKGADEKDGFLKKYPVDLELDHVLGKMPQKVIQHYI